jgi:APA family basic amino acid/polyamine antiporter
VSFFAGFSAPIAAAALAFAEYVGYFWPAFDQQHSRTIGGGLLSIQIGGAQALASLLIVLLTLINVFGVQRVARFQNVLTGAKLAVIISFIVFGFAAGVGSLSHFSTAIPRPPGTSLLAQFALCLSIIYVSYSGWDAATYVAEELHAPEKTLPRALIVGTLIVAALFIGLNAVFIYGVSLDQMKDVVRVGALAASHLFGPGIGGVYSALMALSLVSTVNAMVTIGPRVYYAMAKNRAFIASAAKVDARWHTPVVAIVCQGLCAVLMTATSFAQLFLYVGVTLNFFAAMSVAALLVLRKRPSWQKLPAVSFAYPLIPVLFLLVSGWTFATGLRLIPKVSMWSILTIVTGALFYHWRIKRA